jgi:malic enzyme
MPSPSLEPRTVVRGTPYRGVHLLREPLLNKGTAFTREEREVFALEGLLPHAVSTQDQQARRAYANITRKADPLERYIGMAALQDRNEHLFYRVLLDHLEELLPVVYTPTVGLACRDYSHIFRRGRGLWITPAHRGHVADVLSYAPSEEVRLIVATDNERILGLGDQGAGGMGIPIGKLALYTVAAGIHPSSTLPVSLDVGTDNPDLLADDLYLGWRHPRLRGAEYAALVEEFVQAVRMRFPYALLQWEDFKKGTALHLLDTYRRLLPSFSDDIQGTAAVALAAIRAAERSTGSLLAAERVLVLGAGAAGVGIARLLRATLRDGGMPAERVPEAIAVLDSRGLLVDDAEIAEGSKRELAWPAALARRHALVPGRRDLEAVVRGFRPTVLIGTSGGAGAFTRGAVQAMAEAVPRPVILPLSGPPSRAEATPEDLLSWTGGRALVATGSPFPPVPVHGGTLSVAQANTAFVFPGVALAAIAGEATQVTDGMFAAAAEALAGEVSMADLAAGRLLPPMARMRQVTRAVAAAVLEQARGEGVAPAALDVPETDLVAGAMWRPEYPVLLPARPGELD